VAWADHPRLPSLAARPSLGEPAVPGGSAATG